MSALFFTACERLLSATTNSVYQGILVAGLAGLTLRLFNRTNAATRHAVWFGVLLFVAALIPAHLFLSGRAHPEILVTATTPAPMAGTLATPHDENFDGSPIGDAALPVPPPGETVGDSLNATANSTVNEPQRQWSSRDVGSGSRRDAVPTEKTWARFIPASLKPSSWHQETAIALPHWICLCLVSAWALLATVRGGLIARRLIEVRRVKTGSNAPSQALQTLFDRLRDSLAARRNVRLRISSTHRTAVVLGFVHPVVLIPSEMDKEGNAYELEHVLRHEVAHVDRRDDWGNLAQQLIQAALFFHPAVWWISKKLSLEREIACDDHVLEASGQPRAYALTLANVASRMSHRQALLAPGVSNNHSQLQERITMILNSDRDRSPRLARNRLGFFTTAIAILAVLAITAGPRLVLAQPPEPPPPPSEASEVAPPPEPPEAPVIAAAPVALPPDEPGVDSGPKSKPDANDNNDNDNDNDGDNAPVAASATLSVTPASPSTPALVAVSPASSEAPMPEAIPAPRHQKRNMSVEERLDRLERIIQDLEARDGVKFRRRADVTAQDGKDWFGAPGAMAMDFNLDMQLKHAADQARKAADEARRAIEDSQRSAEAGQRQAEQAMRDIAKLKSKDMQRMQDDIRNAQSQAPLLQLKALRAARESLQGEMQKLERQIRQLEEDQNHQKQTSQGGPDSSDEGPKAKSIAPE